MFVAAEPLVHVPAASAVLLISRGRAGALVQVHVYTFVVDSCTWLSDSQQSESHIASQFETIRCPLSVQRPRKHPKYVDLA